VNLAPSLLAKYPLVSDQISREELLVVLRELERTLQQGTEGDIVEFGCYLGTTSLFIRRLLDQTDESAKRAFHAYDSFEGLPPKQPADTNAAGVDFKAGELAVSKKQFLHQFQRAHLAPPVTHKAWFDQLADQDVPQKIAFAFLDGDFYDSILASLQLVWPRMSRGGAVLIHDYQRQTLPGVERAVHDFFKGNAPANLQVEHFCARLYYT